MTCFFAAFITLGSRGILPEDCSVPISEDSSAPEDTTLTARPVSALASSQGSMFRAEALTIEADSDDDDNVKASPPTPYKSRTGDVGAGRDYSPRAPLSPLHQQQQPSRPPKLSSFSFAQEEAANASAFSASGPSALQHQPSANRPPSPRWVSQLASRCMQLSNTTGTIGRSAPSFPSWSLYSDVLGPLFGPLPSRPSSPHTSPLLAGHRSLLSNPKFGNTMMAAAPAYEEEEEQEQEYATGREHQGDGRGRPAGRWSDASGERQHP